jgi:hypothetical protein
MALHAKKTILFIVTAVRTGVSERLFPALFPGMTEMIEFRYKIKRESTY